MKSFELRRQLFHIILGVVLVLLIYYDIFNAFILFAFVVLGVALSLIARKRRIPILHWFLDKFEREQYIKTFPGRGKIYFFAGALLAVVLFEKNVALAALMILTFGDSFSHFIGRFYGKRKHPLSNIKLLEGTVAGIIAGTLGAMIFVPLHEALFASVIAMSVEVVELKIKDRTIDDNLVIPVVAGLAIFVLRVAKGLV